MPLQVVQAQESIKAAEQIMAKKAKDDTFEYDQAKEERLRHSPPPLDPNPHGASATLPWSVIPRGVPNRGGRGVGARALDAHGQLPRDPPPPRPRNASSQGATPPHRPACAPLFRERTLEPLDSRAPGKKQQAEARRR